MMRSSLRCVSRTVTTLSRCREASGTLAVRTFSAEPSTPADQGVLDTRFEGIGQPFSKDITGVLSQPIDESAVILARDGTLKVSEEYYTEVLNKAFGFGGWTLVPVGEIKDLDLSDGGGDQKEFVVLIREYSLYCHERFVSQAFGETPFYPNKQYYSEATERIKASALARCCKDLGIASELWNKRWAENYRLKHGVQDWVENVTNGRKNNLWRKKDEEWSWPYKKSTSFKKAF